DWGVVFNGDKRMYFVSESKGDIDEDELRTSEKLRIACGEKHFEKLDGVEFKVAKEAKELIK
ncbi:MAG: hypothetical protein WD607_08930, partial [Candidatus Paceibacterota bacterium]